jgi:enoyl-CoA hydratase/carnithine racemase
VNTDAFKTELNEARRIGTLTFTRPKGGNRLSAQEIPLVGQAIRSLGALKEVKVVVVRGEGDHFCLGRSPDPPGTAPTTALAIRAGITQPILDVYADVRATPVPVIALVQGEAKGFGCALVAQCDLAIAGDDARFSLPEMDHHLPPTLAISAMLHKVPLKRLLHMVYTRKPIGAAEALSLGLLSEVAKTAQLGQALEETLASLLDRNRAALCAVKEYVGVALYTDPHGAARLAANLLSCVLASPKEE